MVLVSLTVRMQFFTFLFLIFKKNSINVLLKLHYLFLVLNSVIQEIFGILSQYQMCVCWHFKPLFVGCFFVYWLFLLLYRSLLALCNSFSLFFYSCLWFWYPFPCLPLKNVQESFPYFFRSFMVQVLLRFLIQFHFIFRLMFLVIYAIGCVLLFAFFET